MDINNFRLCIMDLKQILLAATGRPLVRMEIEQGCEYLIDNAATVVPQLITKGWLLTKAGQNPPNAL